VPHFAVWARPMWKGAPGREFLTYTVECESPFEAIDYVLSPELGFAFGRDHSFWILRAVAVTITPDVLVDGAEGEAG